MEGIRLNKFIASSGLAARRKADELIFEGRVTVNGKDVFDPGVRVDPENDTVKVDGQLIRVKDREPIFILLYKPKGYITSTSDEKNRPTVMDLVKVRDRIYPVGRLDFDSEGLLLLTNDGEMANKLMHPKYEVNKTYVVKINHPISPEQVSRLSEGVLIEGRKTGKSKVHVLPGTGNKEIKISIHEGRNRQVRKMLEAVGLFVRRLRRVEYAGLNDPGLKPGSWRFLDPTEVKKLKNITLKKSTKSAGTERTGKKKNRRD